MVLGFWFFSDLERRMTPSLFDMTGRVALVTGAAAGMGRAMALAFAECGADLMLADIDPEGAERTAAAIRALGRRAVPVTCDITDLKQIDALFERLDREYGRIDVLGNVYGPGAISEPEETTVEEIEHVLHGLVVARFYACQQAGRRMLRAGRGSIINIGSIGGVTSLGRGQVAYGMGMAAVAQLTRELSTAWSSRGVRVNCILPAQVLNPGLEERINADPELRSVFLRGIPSGRFGRPDDIKGLAAFLASDSAEWITGAIIPMDGGNLAKNPGGSHPGMPGFGLG
jgi:NAD(P)-dependent dehydrogenase (short-subunit alcohol dehydrogenase family)